MNRSHKSSGGDEGDARARLSAIVEGSSEAIIATDLSGIVTAWNRGAEALYGYTADEAVGAHISLIHPDRDGTLADQILEKISRGEANETTEGVRVRADGSLVTVELKISPIFGDSGAVIGTSSIARNIADRLQRERLLRENQEFLERTQEIARIGGWKTLIGPESLLTFTAETYRIFGLEPATPLRNLDFFNFVHPDDRDVFVERIIRARTDHHRAELEVRVIPPDGEMRWVFVTADALVDDSGEPIGLSGIVADITERKQAELRSEHDAVHDQLTGLPNRLLFVDRVLRALARASASGSKIAVLFINLDRFKLVNDARGDDHGDVVLRAVANRLRAATPLTDTVAHFGADEFGVISEHIDTAADAAQIASRIVETVARPFVLGRYEESITASVGVAVGGSEDSAEALLRDADLAMQRAKEEGRNRFELYDIGLRDQVQHRIALEAALRRVSERDELFLAFQPIASLAESRFVGAEALLRWRRPDGGVVMPNDFIPAAEETGLIVPFGTWAIEAACEQLGSWLASNGQRPDWTISVNVAAAQLRAPDFPDVVEHALSRAGIDGSSLWIELTESALIDGGESNTALARVRELGVRISIDDFGTKYSSLSYLTRLAIDELKIDQTFVDGILADQSNRAVISAIMAIGQTLDLAVTAEGVETKAQLDELLRLGCSSAQGNFFAKALPPDECLAVLRTSPDDAASRL